MADMKSIKSKDTGKKKIFAGKNSYALSAILLSAFFSVSFFYTELVFKYSVSAFLIDFSVFYMLIFSLLTGSAVAVLVYMLPKVLSNIVAVISLLATEIWFLVELFIQRQFAVFYDLYTITNAAVDAAKGFGDDIRALIISVDGITHIILFSVPLVCWFVFGRRIVSGVKKMSMGLPVRDGSYSRAERGTKEIPEMDMIDLSDEDITPEIEIEEKPVKDVKNLERRFIAGFIPAGFCLLGTSVLMIMISVSAVDRDTFGEKYNFQSSVASYGLANSFYLDLKYVNDDKSSDSEFILVDDFGDEGFSVADSTGEYTGEQAGAEGTDESGSGDAAQTQEKKEYGVNAYDLDFEALAAEGDSFSTLNSYVASLTPSSKNEYTGLFEGKNLIVFCAEAFSGSIIDPELTPALYRLSTKGINFNDYYEQATAGTTGGEFELIYGLMPMAGGDSMLTMTAQGSYTNMGAMLSSDMGYYGMAFHDNDDLYYSRNITHNLLGYSEGFMGFGNGMEKLVSRAWPASDLEMMQGTLPLYSDHQPFNVYYMTVSAHSRYDFVSNAMSRKNKDVIDAWCEEKGLDYSEPVRAYIACNMELEYALEYTLQYLEENGLADDTVIALAPDHFPYGLTNGGYLGNLPYLDELYGYKVDGQLARDKNRAIIWCGVLEDMDPIIIDKPTSPLDILPTLLNLFGCEWDSRLYIGRDVLSNAEGLYFDSGYNWKTEVGTYIASTGTFTPNPGYEDVGEAYIKRHNAIVANKVSFNRKVIYNPYFPYVYQKVAEQKASGEGLESTETDEN